MKFYLLGDVSLMQYLFAVSFCRDGIRMFESYLVISLRICLDGVCSQMGI